MQSSRWVDDWRETLGRGWRLQFAFFALCLFVAGAGVPLADPDLPIHLATGEWIVRHHAVPFTEPWAWTRAGAPFQAYSWAIETAYYVIFVHFGRIGLHALQGMVYVALGASIVVLGRAAKWRAWTTIAVEAIHLIIALGATPFLRPQAILLIATPLSWALVLRARDADHLRWELAALVLVSAVVANTHLLFPITAAPCVLLLTRMPDDRRRLVTIPAAIALGWLFTPYALHWVEIYKLYFAPNALFGPPSAIAEYRPGFSSVVESGPSSLVVCVCFVVLPWVVAPRYSPRERLMHGLLWLSGLLMFALATRALAIWWLLIIPTAAVALESLPTMTTPILRTTQRAAVLAIFACIGLVGLSDYRDSRALERSPVNRALPSITARSIEPIADWIDCNVRHQAGGRLITTFNFGGYVPWRLPYLSESIDGRTIFPDSVAKAETYFPPNRPTIPLPPWRTADLAIFPFNFPMAAVLDTATGWRRVALSNQLDGKSTMIGLWVTDRWWATAGRGRLPRTPVPLYQRVTHAAGAADVSCGSH